MHYNMLYCLQLIASLTKLARIRDDHCELVNPVTRLAVLVSTGILIADVIFVLFILHVMWTTSVVCTTCDVDH